MTFTFKNVVTISEIKMYSDNLKCKFYDASGQLITEFVTPGGKGLTTKENFNKTVKRIEFSKNLGGLGAELYEIEILGVEADGIPPSILSVQPASGRVDVDIESDVLLTFSELLKADVGRAQIVGIETTQTIASNIVRLHPSVKLKYDTVYTVKASGFADLNGNIQSNEYTYSFKTAKDIRPPEIINIIPPPDGTNIPLDTQVKIQFSKPIDSTYIDNVYISGVEVNKEVVGDTVVMKLVSELEYDHQYNIHIEGVRDTLGNVMVGKVDCKFNTISDSSPLNLVSYKPPSGVFPLNQRFEFVFNKNIKSDSVNIDLKDSDGNVITFAKSVVGTKVVISPVLSPNKDYVFIFKSATDLNGNLYNTPVRIDFKTMASSGEKALDDITTGNLNLFSSVKSSGINILIKAIAIAIIFICGLWLWRKTKLWLQKTK